MSAAATSTQPLEPGGPGALTRADLIELLHALELATTSERGPSLDELAGAVSAATALDRADQLFTPEHLRVAHVARAATAGHSGPDSRGRASPQRLACIPGGAAVAIAAGAALAIEEADPRVAMAIVRAEWLAEGATGRALALARRRSLRLVVVALGPPAAGVRHLPPPVDGGDVIAVLSAARSTLAAVRDGRGPALLSCARPGDPRGGRPGDPRDAEAELDPVSRYRRWLAARGFSRQELGVGLR
jgi:TPP-dependent pyruvate/acetoin dehydrogenase alpha subunit